MVDLHRLPSSAQVEQEASEWIARLNADDVTAEDRSRFEAWRAAHPLHARAYDELSATWRELRKVAPLVRAVSFGQAMNAAAARPVRARQWLALSAIAGVLAVVLGFSWYVRSLTTTESLFQTAIGERVQLALPDGSSLELNSNSVVRVDYSKRMRLVRLDRGEAFFNVAHDTQRPFWVVADNSWLRAVGTAFNVYIGPAGVRVTVSEGAVKIASARSDTDTPSDSALQDVAVSVLTAGGQANVQGRAAEIRNLEPTELMRSVAWRGGTLSFEDEPLGTVLEEMSRYTTLQIEVKGEVLRRLPVGGTFQASPEGVEALLRMLEDGFGLAVRRNGQRRVEIEEQPAK